MTAIRQTPTAPPVFETADDAFVQHFHQNGFALLGGALSAEEVSRINADAVALCRGEYGTIGGSEAATADPATDLAALDDDDVLRRFLCIHFPHKVMDSAMDALRAPRVVDALTRVIGPNIKAMQSMLFIKSEGKPGQAWHQDEYFIPTRDRSLTAVWIALDDATIENGCLWVIPGSHRPSILHRVRGQEDPRFDCTVEAYDFPYRDEDSVPVQIPAGTAVIFNGYLLHRSLQNSGAHGYRRAITNHYMSAESVLPWSPPKEGEHMAIADQRDIVLVAGTDPYAYKGIEDVHRPHSRPDKEGGCFW